MIYTTYKSPKKNWPAGSSYGMPNGYCYHWNGLSRIASPPHIQIYIFLSEFQKKIRNLFSHRQSMNKPEHPFPSDFAQERPVFIQWQPDKIGFPDNVVLRNETPETGIGGTMTIVPHHPIIVHLKRVRVRRLPVEVNHRIPHLQLIPLVCTDNPFIQRQGPHSQLNRIALLRHV